MNFKRMAVAALTSLALLTGTAAANAAVYWPTAAESLTKTSFVRLWARFHVQT